MRTKAVILTSHDTHQVGHVVTRAEQLFDQYPELFVGLCVQFAESDMSVHEAFVEEADGQGVEGYARLRHLLTVVDEGARRLLLGSVFVSLLAHVAWTWSLGDCEIDGVVDGDDDEEYTPLRG